MLSRISCLLWTAPLLLGCAGSPADTAPVAFVDKNPCVPDVEASFAGLASDGVPLAVHDGALFQGEDASLFTLTGDNNFGIDNHFQGVQRADSHLFLSGGDIKSLKASVFVAQLASRPDDRAFGSNIAEGEVPTEDRLVTTIELDGGLEWHSGGLAVVGNILAVPTENTREEIGKRSSSVHFWDVSDAEQPVPIGQPLARGPRTVAHAVGLAKLIADGRFLLVNWDDRKLEFYVSVGTDFVLGFPAKPASVVSTSEVLIETEERGDAGVLGQNVSLLSQCDGTIYALLADNTVSLPSESGVNFADLYRLDFPGGDPMETPSIHKVASRVFQCPAQQGCNFVAAGGTWVAPDGSLHFYSAPHFRDPESGTTPFAEF